MNSELGNQISQKQQMTLKPEMVAELKVLKKKYRSILEKLGVHLDHVVDIHKKISFPNLSQEGSFLIARKY